MNLSLVGAPTHDFNELLHHLRTQALGSLPPDAQVVLSGGCSGAWYFDWFAAAYPTPIARHIGVEAYSPRPETLPPGVEWIDNSLGNLHDVADQSVDLVFAGQVIEHMWADEVTGFLLEAHRVLRPGGTICIDSPNRLVSLDAGWRQPEHTVEFTVDEAEAMLRLAGFENVNTTGIWLGRDTATGSALPVEIDEGGANWNWRRRVREAPARPHDSFVWWAVAERRDTAPLPGPLEEYVGGVFVVARPQYLARIRTEQGFFENGGFVAASAGTPGYILVGPNVAMPAGRGTVTARLRAQSDGNISSEDVVARVEVTADGQKIASRDVFLGELAASEFVGIECPFWFETTAFDVEFRIWTLGRLRIEVDPALAVVSDADHDPDSDLERRLRVAQTQNVALGAALAQAQTRMTLRAARMLKRHYLASRARRSR